MKNEYRRLATLYDIRLFCDRIRDITSEFTREQIEEDYVKLDALHHNFAKIGEATNRILQNDPEGAAKLQARIPRIRDVVDFRNVVLHDYDEVNNDEVWGIIEDHFPIFYQTIADFLEEFNPPDPEPDKSSTGSKL